jgi:iron complex outermembrane receptor protein
VGIGGRLSYRGRSRLGLLTSSDAKQGNVLSSNLTTRLTVGRYTASIEVENLANSRSNLFGYGNPFTLGRERQITPQRPRTVTLGLHAVF